MATCKVHNVLTLPSGKKPRTPAGTDYVGLGTGIEGAAEGGEELNEHQLQRLHAILGPFMLRRIKADVAAELAPKHERTLFCEPSPRQQVCSPTAATKRSTKGWGTFFALFTRPQTHTLPIRSLSASFIPYPKAVARCITGMPTILAPWDLLA